MISGQVTHFYQSY